jgi:hypothetical protein
MGDGQHGWAAAEWVMILRNCFVREEDERLVVGSGLFPEWFASGDELAFGPTATPWGNVTIRIKQPSTEPQLAIDGVWRERAPRVDVFVPGFRPLCDIDCRSVARLKRMESGEAIDKPAPV